MIQTSFDGIFVTYITATVFFRGTVESTQTRIHAFCCQTFEPDILNNYDARSEKVYVGVYLCLCRLNKNTNLVILICSKLHKIPYQLNVRQVILAFTQSDTTEAETTAVFSLPSG